MEYQNNLDHDLALAVKNKHLKDIKKLLVLGANVNSRIVSRGSESLLSYACTFQDKAFFPIAKYLISKKADIFAQDGFGNQALHYAAFFNTKSINLLLKGLFAKCG